MDGGWIDSLAPNEVGDVVRAATGGRVDGTRSVSL